MGYILGVISLGLYRDNGKKMETTISGLGFRV